MSITASQVNSLRKRTGISMMQCKKALEEANGNEELAIENLRKRGEAKAASKASRDTNEGLTLTKISGNKGVIVKLSCETDFVSKNKDFIAIANNAMDIALSDGVEKAKESQEEAIKELFTKLGENMNLEIKVLEGENLASYVHSNSKIAVLVSLENPDTEKATDIAMHAAAMSPTVINPEEVSDDLVAKEKEIWREQLKNEGKPEEMLDKIMIGKERKFREENALSKQSFVKDPNLTIEAYLDGNKILDFIRVSI